MAYFWQSPPWQKLRSGQWLTASRAFYLAVIAAILRRLRQDGGAIAHIWLPVAAAFPEVFINLGHGQIGFLTARLLGAALVALPQRPILSGILFGRPQAAIRALIMRRAMMERAGLIDHRFTANRASVI